MESMLSEQEKREDEREDDLEWVETGEPLEDLSTEERESAERGDWTGGKLVLMGVIHVGSRT